MFNFIKKVWNKDAYYNQKFKKNLIVLHHTAGYGIEGSKKYLEGQSLKKWKESRYKLGVAWWIGRNGEKINTFDDAFWAFHTGAGGVYDKRSIGIEMANLGYLVKKDDGKFYDCYGKVVSEDRVYDAGFVWRGYQYWERYTIEQIDALVEIVNHLCERFGIPKDVPIEFFPSGKRDMRKFKGIICHTHLRDEHSKWDLSVAFQEHLGRFLAGTGAITRA